MKNRYEKNAKISERELRLVLKAFSLDIPALTAAKLYGMNYRSIHRLYTLLRERFLRLALLELEPFVGEIEVDESYSLGNSEMKFTGCFPYCNDLVMRNCMTMEGDMSCLG